MIKSSCWLRYATLACLLATSGIGLNSQPVQASLFNPKPGSSAPSEATGGASRGNFFTPAPGSEAVGGSTGGSGRGGLSLFVPASDRRRVRRSSGGSRSGLLFIPKKERGSVQEATAGGSRTGFNGPAAMLALLPKTYSGTTITSHPGFMTYIPPSQAKTAIFSLQDEQRRTVHTMRLSIAGKSGIIPVQLPQSAPGLEVNKQYRWIITLVMDNHEFGPRSPYVQGWIQRIQPTADLSRQLRSNDPMQRAAALGAEGIWYDCLAEVAQAKTISPSNGLATKAWESLLTDVGLKSVANVPFDRS